MELRVGKKFRVGAKIGAGNNSDIYAGTNVDTGEEIAIKLEATRRRSKHLQNEVRVYRLLGKHGTIENNFPIDETYFNNLIILYIGIGFLYISVEHF